jgi:hypothetical protein
MINAYGTDVRTIIYKGTRSSGREACHNVIFPKHIPRDLTLGRILSRRNTVFIIAAIVRVMTPCSPYLN